MPTATCLVCLLLSAHQGSIVRRCVHVGGHRTAPSTPAICDLSPPGAHRPILLLLLPVASFLRHRICARRPSLLLLLPVACFLLGATLIAVYWPLNVRPDGGRGAMDGAGTAFRPPGTTSPI